MMRKHVCPPRKHIATLTSMPSLRFIAQTTPDQKASLELVCRAQQKSKAWAVPEREEEVERGEIQVRVPQETPLFGSLNRINSNLEESETEGLECTIYGSNWSQSLTCWSRQELEN